MASGSAAAYATKTDAVTRFLRSEEARKLAKTMGVNTEQPDLATITAMWDALSMRSLKNAIDHMTPTKVRNGERQIARRLLSEDPLHWDPGSLSNWGNPVEVVGAQ